MIWWYSETSKPDLGNYSDKMYQQYIYLEYLNNFKVENPCFVDSFT